MRPGPTHEQLVTAAFAVWFAHETHTGIARALSINRRTLTRWKRRPEFAAVTAALDAVWEAGYAAGEEDALLARADPRDLAFVAGILLRNPDLIERTVREGSSPPVHPQKRARARERDEIERSP